MRNVVPKPRYWVFLAAFLITISVLLPASDMLQQEIPDVSAEGIIDYAKLLDINYGDRAAGLGFAQPRQHPSQSLAEQRPLREPGVGVEV